MTSPNGHTARAELIVPLWTRLMPRPDLAGPCMLPLCAACGVAIEQGYIFGDAGGALVRLALCDDCATDLLAAVAEVEEISLVDRRGDITVQVSWSPAAGLRTTEVLVWPAQGEMTATQEADLVELAAVRLCDYLAGYEEARRADTAEAPS